MGTELTDTNGRPFRLRVLANAIARHVGPGEWASHGQVAEAVEKLTGHRTTGVAVGSALQPVQDGGYVAFRVRAADGRFRPFDHQVIAVDASTAELFAGAEGICDEHGDAKPEARLATSDLIERARVTVDRLLADGAT